MCTVYICVYTGMGTGREGILPDDFAYPVPSVDIFFLSSLLPPVSALILSQVLGFRF